VASNIYLAGGAYTPMGGFNGAFAEVSAPKLGSVSIRKTLERTGLKPGDVDEVYFGNCISAGLGQSVARQAALGAGLPPSCGAVTLNKMCGSGMRAIVFASQAIRAGDASCLIAGGTENMTQAPYLLTKGRSGYRLGHGQVLDAMLRDGLLNAYDDRHMGVFAEICAKKYGFTREQQDDYAIASFKRALAAQDAGYFKNVIAPVEVVSKRGTVVVDRDEEPAKFVEAKFRELKPVFDPHGTITAGNASAISDGASSIAVLSEARAKALGVPVQARVIGHATASQEPEWYTTAPVAALRRLSDKLNLKLSDVELFEINEAFAPVVLYAMKELELPHAKVNIFGGAIAMGHPIGSSGSRIVVSLINALKITGKKLGVACLCIGGGEASALALEIV
jgi:acetyl-CoA C-acetyltransferase